MSVIEVRRSAWSYVLDEPARVLVADDDPILREFATVHLSSPTATILTARDGTAALELLLAQPCDIAILDIEMPGLDGFTLLERIRSEPSLKRLPVMMLTGLEDIASIDRAFNLGANAFASKPVNWRLLSYQIRYVLRSSGLERQLRDGRAPRPADDKKAAFNAALRAILREAAETSIASEERLRRVEQIAASVLGVLTADGEPLRNINIEGEAAPPHERMLEGV